MRRYSAAEAIGPAWEHAKAWLWHGTSKKTYLALATVASLAGTFSASGGFSNDNFRNRMAAFNAGPTSPLVPMHTPHLHGAALVPFWLIFTIVAAVLFYVSIRFKFVLVNALATRRRTIRPLWEIYGEATWQWIGLTVVLVLAAAAIGAAIFFTLKHTGMTRGATALFAGLAVPISILTALIVWTLRDFVLPVVALEGTSIGTAWQCAMDALSAEPGEFALYFLLKLIVTFVLVVVRVVVFVLAVVLLAVPFVLIGILPVIFFHGFGVIGAAIAILVAFVLLFAYFITSICLLFAISGPVSAFVVSWGLYFYGGRYALLGEMLEPAVAIPTYTPPPSFPTDDHTSPGEPDLPMNPEPAM